MQFRYVVMSVQFSPWDKQYYSYRFVHTFEDDNQELAPSDVTHAVVYTPKGEFVCVRVKKITEISKDEYRQLNWKDAVMLFSENDFDAQTYRLAKIVCS